MHRPFLESLPQLRNRQSPEVGDVSRSNPAIGDTTPYEQAQQTRAIDDAHRELLQLQIRERELLTRFNETSRPVVTVREQIALVQKFLEQQEAKIGPGPQSELITTRADMRFQEVRRDTLVQQLRQLRDELLSLPELERQYRFEDHRQQPQLGVQSRPRRRQLRGRFPVLPRTRRSGPDVS